ncbi:L-xylulose/3-keto-L-gulonate kinase [archaeon HR01]|nr:L-xylulose/3-keto-L-gulonate kinase [archaeon HR01]
MAGDKRCLIGLDVGTSSVKALAVNLEGVQVAASKAQLTIHSPSRDLYIQYADEMRESIYRVLNMLTHSLGGWRIEAVGVTGQSISPVVMDKEGNPIHPVISHLDTRSVLVADELSETVGRLGYVGTKLVANLVWLRRSRPDLWKRIEMVADVKEYAGYLLTGKNTSDQILYLIEDLERLCRELDIPLHWFGEKHSFKDVVGYITAEAERETGIPAGTPVIIALGDSLASPLGSGVARAGDMADVCGATEIMSAATYEARDVLTFPYPINGLKITSHSPPIGLAHKWIVERIAEISGVEREKAYKVFEEMAEKAGPGAGGLVFLPGSFKTFPKRFDAAFAGITYFHDLRHFARAFYEGAALELRKTVEDFERAGAKVDRIVVSGGGATSFNCQLKADILDREIDVPEIKETGCMGAALIAGYALGIYSTLEEAVSTVKISKKFFRSSNHDYGREYSKYLELRELCGRIL